MKPELLFWGTMADTQDLERIVDFVVRPSSCEFSDLQSIPGNKGLPPNLLAKIQPVLQISTSTPYFYHVNMISGAQ